MALEAAGQLGNMIGQMLRGDPQQAARQRAEAEARAIEQQRIEVERARKRQEDFARLRSTLKLDNFDGDRGGLLLKGIDVAGAGGQGTPPAAADNALGLKLGDDDDLQPRGTQAAANSGPAEGPAPNTDPMVVDLRTAPSGMASDSGGKLALKLGDDDVQPQVATATAPTPAAEPAPEPAPASTTATAPAPDNSNAFAIEPAPEPAPAVEPAPAPDTAPAQTPAPAPNTNSVAVNPAAKKTIDILDRAVSSAVESLKAGQSGESLDIDGELSEIKAVLNTPPSGKIGDQTVRDISFGHQQSARSGEKQNVGKILVVRNEETGEVHIDVLQEQTGKPVTQRIIHIDRFGNIIAQEGR